MSVQILEKPNWPKLLKNVKFGIAVGLTKTAKDGQKASQDAIRSTFTVRGNWWQQSNKFGIRITPAKRDELVAEVKTAADWLAIHETGGRKEPRGRNLAVPTDNVKRSKRQIIVKAQRPRNLKDAFVLNTRKGPVIFRRMFMNAKGRTTGRKIRGVKGALVALFGLEPSVRIRKQSTFYEPIQKAVNENLVNNVAREIRNALDTMR